MIYLKCKQKERVHDKHMCLHGLVALAYRKIPIFPAKTKKNGCEKNSHRHTSTHTPTRYYNKRLKQMARMWLFIRFSGPFIFHRDESDDYSTTVVLVLLCVQRVCVCAASTMYEFAVHTTQSVTWYHFCYWRCCFNLFVDFVILSTDPLLI